MRQRNIIITKSYESPCGTLLLGSLEGELCLCDWQDGKHHSQVLRRLQRALQAEYENGASVIIGKTTRELDEFFAGKRQTFDIPLLFTGTGFQKEVWNELLKIAFGQSISYAELTRRLGRPESIRAVANAIGANAISILVPCHRVIGSDHSLTGYAGGLSAKRLLLELESVITLLP